MEDLKQKILERVACNIQTKCWEWTIKTNPQGYGTFKNKRVHRLSYEIFKEKIPENYVIDHICHNKKCLNPDHLKAVTHAENGSRERARHWNSLKTVCIRGHEYNEENTDFYLRKKESGYGHDGWNMRVCKQCKRIWQQNRKEGKSKPRMHVHQRFLEKVSPNEDGCWEWQASTVNGYGKFKYEGIMQLAHRVSFRMFVGEFDHSLVVDHMCFNKTCVNPSHLDIMTLQENSRKGGKK